MPCAISPRLLCALRVDHLDADERGGGRDAAPLRPARAGAGEDPGDQAAVAEIVVGRGPPVDEVLEADHLRAPEVGHRGVDPGVDHRGDQAVAVEVGEVLARAARRRTTLWALTPNGTATASSSTCATSARRGERADLPRRRARRERVDQPQPP